MIENGEVMDWEATAKEVDDVSEYGKVTDCGNVARLRIGENVAN
jgi:hypothetical protein